MKKAAWRRLWRKRNKRDISEQGPLNAAQRLLGSFFGSGSDTIYGPEKEEPMKQPKAGSIAQGGHKHKREIARRLRQLEAQERKREKVGLA